MKQQAGSGKLVGRKFSRYPFPDEVGYWFKPLGDVAQSKHSNAASAEGRAFSQVGQLRVEVTTPWNEPPFGLTLIVILKRDALPPFSGDELPEPIPSLQEWLRPGGRLRPVADLSARLEETNDLGERYWLWHGIGEAWAARCKPRTSDLRQLSHDAQMNVLSAVLDGEITSDVTTEDEFSMYRYVRSEMLDLDHLSPSVPLLDSPIRERFITDSPSAGPGHRRIEWRAWFRRRMR